MRYSPLIVLLLFCMLGVAPGCDSSGTVPDDGQQTVRLTFSVPAGTPPVYLTGNLDTLGPWNPAGQRLEGQDTLRSAVLELPRDFTFEYKVTLGSWDQEALSAQGTVPPNYRMTVQSDTSVHHVIPGFGTSEEDPLTDWQNSGVRGQLVYWRDVDSQFLDERRHVGIWLPPGYDASDTTRYAVLYMHDGQNLFDPRLSFTGVDWGVDEAMMRGVEAGAYEAAIVVGVFNSPNRFREYSPWHQADRYARFLIDELMPRVNASFKTRTGPTQTFTMGSSMGGLLSYFLVTEHPETFGACGCVSTPLGLTPGEVASARPYEADGYADQPSVPYFEQDLEDGKTVPPTARLFFDYGTAEPDRLYATPHTLARTWLLNQNLEEDRDFRIQAYPGATHTEASWRARVGDHLAWMLDR